MSSRSNPVPATIGRFRVDALLGIGGMGEVYKAFDPTLQRTIAVKIVRPDVDRPDSLDRLYREAQACARLQHPNIVTVYKAGELDGVVYIAMEFLNGEDLAAVLRRGQLSIETKIGILLHVLDALQHAHANDVIHRDIKPSNVYRQSDGSIKLVDFGLARVIEAETLTVTGTVMGTPHYASPEQLKGLRVDPRTDIYSTGVLAYKMFSGRRPFAGDNDSVATIVLKVISEPAPPMDVPWSQTLPEIERIVARAMAKSPDERYRSAEEMRHALAAFLTSSRDAIASAQVQASAAAPTGDEPTLPVQRRDPPLRVAPPSEAPPSPEVRPPSAGAVSLGRSPTLPDSSSGAVVTTPRRSRAVWWAAAAIAAIVIAAVSIVPRLPAAATENAGIADAPAPTTNASAATAVPRAAVPPAADPQTNRSAPGNQSPPAFAQGSGPAPASGVAAANRSGQAPTPVDTTPPAETRDASAKQLFFGPGNAAAAGTAAAAPGRPTAQTLNAGLRYRLILQSSAGAEAEVDPVTEFRSGDKVRFAFESNIDGHLYVAQLGTSGRWTVIFPNPEINEGRNAIKGFEQYLVPNNGWFAFDDTPGIEQVFVFLSREPLEQLPGFDRPVTTLESVRASVVENLQQSIRSRDLVFQKDRSNSSAGKPGMVTYVVNRDEVGKAITASIQLKHGR